MPVSTVNSGLGPNQSALKSALPQRGNLPPVADSDPANGGSAILSAIQESVVVNLGGSSGAPISHSIRVGVAAYVAIMNPRASASMRTEA
jgi:hypothetical protein